MAGRENDIDEILDATEPPVPPPPPDLPEPPVVTRKRGLRWKLWATVLLIGGAVFAGWQAPTWLGLQQSNAGVVALETRLAESEATLAALRGELEALKSGLTEVQARPAGLSADALAPLQASIDAATQSEAAKAEAVETLASRLSALERAAAAAPDGTIPDTALAGLQAQIDEVRRTSEEAQGALDDVVARLTALEQTPAPDAAPVAANTLGEIAAALETGQPFASALLALREARPDAEGLEMLALHANGVLTLTALQAGFPDAARAALSAARATEAAEGETSSRLGAFFRDQLGMRSLSPQDGSDADAVLSRAEAALTSGDLGATVSELAGLPDSAKPAMADWLAAAQARLDALAALAALQEG
jgi:hypothetical protein